MLEVVVSGLVTGWAIAIPIGAVGAFLVTLASWQLLLAGGGAALGRVATGRRSHLATGLVSAVVIAALAVRTMLP